MPQATFQDLTAANGGLTPGMKQYWKIKKQYCDHLLLFRMGDFYEVFFEDAHQVSQTLNIALTHRGKVGGNPIPMAGIPHHAASTYVDRLTSAGFKAAICEQVQDAKESKGIVDRAVTRIVSPGIPFDLGQADPRECYYIAAGLCRGDIFFLVVIDFTTGEFNGAKLPHRQRFVETLKAYDPKELITFPGQWKSFPEMNSLCQGNHLLQTHLAPEYFDPQHTKHSIEKLIPRYRRDKVLSLSPEILSPIGALAWYIDSTRPFEKKSNAFFHLAPFRMLSEEGRMKITLPTLTGLEILPASSKLYRSSLLGLLDKCKTSMGSRVLKRLLISPLSDLQAIRSRLNLIEFFIAHDTLLIDMRQKLERVRDLERILSKASTGSITPSDLHGIARTVRTWESLPLEELPCDILNPLNANSRQVLSDLAGSIETFINDEIGASLERGNLIRLGADPQRDELAALAHNVQEELEKLEDRYRKQSGISKLKIKSNNVFGHFIEVGKVWIKKVPENFVRRQTLTNAERYTTDELALFEEKIVTAKDKLAKLEKDILLRQVSLISRAGREIQALASFLGHLDAWLSLAQTAVQEDFTRPGICAPGEEREILFEGLWHPLIKSLNRGPFIPHDLHLNQRTFFGLITGPNMAGKTTVMRETALAQVLAQIGSFVPAKRARLPLCDYLFSRLGASDDILQGQSTFMVEMSETAEILRHAGKNSLIILDEIGRGTSTYDGLSIAWALTEYLVNNTKAFTLFATHYHELIELVDSLEGAKNFTVETCDEGGDIKFLYRLIEGGAAQSFGIYVAKLAGIPSAILSRSQTILRSLESQNAKSAAIEPPAETLPVIPEHLSRIADSLENIDPLHMTPLQALAKLEEYKKSLKDTHPF